MLVGPQDIWRGVEEIFAVGGTGGIFVSPQNNSEDIAAFQTFHTAVSDGGR
jgi:hypothetical protein